MVGRSWLFVGSLRAGLCAATITSLIRSAQRRGRDPLANLKHVLTRTPMHKGSDIDALLAHHWLPLSTAT